MACGLARKLNRGNGDIGSHRNMEFQQFAVVHFVDVIATKNQDVVRTLTFDGVNVLVNRVGRSLIPLSDARNCGGMVKMNSPLS